MEREAQRHEPKAERIIPNINCIPNDTAWNNQTANQTMNGYLNQLGWVYTELRGDSIQPKADKNDASHDNTQMIAATGEYENESSTLNGKNAPEKRKSSSNTLAVAQAQKKRREPKIFRSTHTMEQNNTWIQRMAGSLCDSISSDVVKGERRLNQQTNAETGGFANSQFAIKPADNNTFQAKKAAGASLEPLPALQPVENYVNSQLQDSNANPPSLGVGDSLKARSNITGDNTTQTLAGNNSLTLSSIQRVEALKKLNPIQHKQLKDQLDRSLEHQSHINNLVNHTKFLLSYQETICHSNSAIQRVEAFKKQEYPVPMPALNQTQHKQLKDQLHRLLEHQSRINNLVNQSKFLMLHHETICNSNSALAQNTSPTSSSVSHSEPVTTPNTFSASRLQDGNSANARSSITSPRHDFESIFAQTKTNRLTLEQRLLERRQWSQKLCLEKEGEGT